MFPDLETLRMAAELLVYSAIFYGLLALLVKGRAAFSDARRAASETRINLSWAALDFILVGPSLFLIVPVLQKVIELSGLGLDPDVWSVLPKAATFVAVIFIGDFVSYWRHRLEHTRLLWPTHAIHHSDRQMSWLTLSRFHPINRLVTSCVDIVVLGLLGFPAWALLANEIVRHYYGEFIHADFPWSYGPIGRVFVSPAMHQWHHARDVKAYGSNFATVFSVFDQAFGTYTPGPCNAPLGVNENVGDSVTRQLAYPFICWYRRIRRAYRGPRPAVRVDPV
jgi:sterol desaturase/sphingolipid hydroxylase (fatty acid hydroxylase superfamily)